MAGFAKFSIIGNTAGIGFLANFFYRSATWLPIGSGNPFGDMLEAVIAFTDNVKTQWLAALPQQYVWQRTEGVGYDDAWNIVTPAPVIHTVQDVGAIQSPAHDSFAIVANIYWQCGVQHQINGLAKSKRNRGYTAFGPIHSQTVSDDGHFTGSYVSTTLDAVANKLSEQINSGTVLDLMVPIRIHEVRALGILTGRTYSDIMGYRLPTRVSFRRSRLPEV